MTVLATLDRPITQADMDAMDDRTYTALSEECYSGGHEQGACPLCADRDLEDDVAYADDDTTARADYLDTLWSRKGFGSRWTTGASGSKPTLESRADDLVLAHAMVKSFVDTFATGTGGRFMVTFDPQITTAGTDYTNKKVIISPAPVLDQTIDAKTAGLVLTAMAVHESSHVRYGASMRSAVNRKWSRTPLGPDAQALSNILQDAVIERAFVAEYPGYAHVFRPAMEYVANAVIRKQGSPDGRIHLSNLAPTNIAGAAIRYAEWTDWSDADIARERDWWQAWADRHGNALTSRAHIAAVQEGLDHIAAASEEKPQESPDQGQSGQQGQSGLGQPGQGQGQGQSDDETDDEDQDADDAEDAEDAETDDDDADEDADESDQTDAIEDAKQQVQDLADDFANQAFGACPSEAVAAAAVANGVSLAAIDGAEASTIVAAAASLHDVQLEGMPKDWVTAKVEARLAKLLGRSARRTQPSPTASAAVRNAFMRSRTGRDAIEKTQPRGRCDNRSLPRIAHQDYRLFHRRTAVSPGKYLVWMLVDWSGSMSGQPMADVEDVVAAIADAARKVPSLRMAVHGWTTPQSGITAHGVAASAGMYEAWRTGQPVSDIGNLHRIAPGGTPDAWVMAYARKAILAEVEQDEKPVLIILSDGQGMGKYTSAEVEAARKAGIRVLCVAIGHISEQYLEATYGRGNYIRFAGSITETAVPLARLLGRMVTV